MNQNQLSKVVWPGSCPLISQTKTRLGNGTIGKGSYCNIRFRRAPFEPTHLELWLRRSVWGLEGAGNQKEGWKKNQKVPTPSLFISTVYIIYVFDLGSVTTRWGMIKTAPVTLLDNRKRCSQLFALSETKFNRGYQGTWGSDLTREITGVSVRSVVIIVLRLFFW